MSLSLRLKDFILRQTPIFQISSRISLSKNSSHIRFKIDVSDHFYQSCSDFTEAGKKKHFKILRRVDVISEAIALFLFTSK